MSERSEKELVDMQEPNGMAGTSQRVRELGPGHAGEAEARPPDETNTSREAELFAFEGDEDNDESKGGDK